MKTVWILQIGEPIPIDTTVRKMRTAILADLLSEKGYKVVWWASAFSHQKREMVFDGEKEYRLKNNLSVYPLKGIIYSKNISLRRYVNLRVIASKFRRIAGKKDKPDIIITSLPCHLLSYEAVRYAKDNRVPIIVDVRDKWPDTLIDVFNSKIIRLILQILLTQDTRRCVYALNNSDMIISVSREFLSWAIDKLRLKSKKTDVLYLGYKREEKYNTTQCPDWLIKYKNKRIIFYVGTFGKSYQIDLVIQAASNIENEIKDAIFIIAGTGQNEKILREISENTKNVIMPGWINKDEINYLLSKSYIGIIPCKSESGTIPNKVFEYLSHGIPIVSSLKGEMEKLIEKNNIGLNYDVDDLYGITIAIKKLMTDDALYKTLSDNAEGFFQEHGNAERIYSKYIEHIEALLNKDEKNEH